MEERIFQIENRISLLELYLYKTDYQAIKKSESELTEEHYAELKEKRKAWRKEINDLQEELKQYGALI